MTTRPELSGTFGMVASTHWLASAAGMAALEKGGNAFDAAVATAFTLQVVQPDQNGPGGDVPILLWSRARGEPLVICGQGPAPRAATIERFRALGLAVIPGTGLLAPCVPGAFDAWLLLLRDFGTAGLADVMAYAIHYAERGFPVTPGLASSIAGVEDLLRVEWRSSAELWLSAGGVPAPGTTVTNPALAVTLRRILREAEQATADRDGQIQRARDVFLRGFVAEAIDEHLRTPAWDSSGRRHAGLMTGEDLAAFAAAVEPPVRHDHAGHTVCKTGPWGQGPVLLQQLALLAGFDLRAMGRDSAAFVHTVLECAKLAFADREAWYGDPAHVEVDVGRCWTASARRRAAAWSASARRSSSGRDRSAAGRPCCRRSPRPPARRPRQASASRAGATPAISTWSTATGTWSPPRRAAGGCRARRRCPGWASRSGRARRCCGSTRAIPTRSPPASARARRSAPRSSSATASRTSRSARRAATSRTSGRVAVPGEVEIESRFAPATLRELAERGHRVRVVDPWSLGELSGVSRGADGILRAGANPRGMQGYAAGR